MTTDKDNAALPERAPVSAGGDAFVFLKTGDVIQLGDEIHESDHEWTRFDEGSAIGTVFDSSEWVSPIRRRIATPATPVGADWVMWHGGPYLTQAAADAVRAPKPAERTLAEVREDAARYRYLRDAELYDDRPEPENWNRAYDSFVIVGASAESINAAIDKAIAADDLHGQQGESNG